MALDNTPDLASDLTNLLSGQTTPEIRSTAAAAVAAHTTPLTSSYALFPKHFPPSSLNLLRALLRLTNDNTNGKQIGRIVLSALTNLSEREDVCVRLQEMGVVGRCVSGVLEGGIWGELYCGVLANVSRYEKVVGMYVGKDGWEVEFRRFMGLLGRLWGTGVMFVGNVAVVEEGRVVVMGLLGECGFLERVGEGDEVVRMGIVGMLRNLLRDVGRVGGLVELGVVERLIGRLVDGRGDIKKEEVEGVREVAELVEEKGRRAENVRGIRLGVCECLLLFCKSRVGRDALRERKAYPVIREWHLLEKDAGIRDVLAAIVDRTELLEEEKDALTLSEKKGNDNESLLQVETC